MTRRISDREWQELSAHLDGQLSAKEAARLQEKLQQSAEMRAAYDDLRRVRILLRSQSRLRAPRNFTLSAEAASLKPVQQTSRRLSPVFGLVSALASVLLVLVIAGELLIGGSQMTAQPVALQAQSEAAMTEAPLAVQVEGAAISKTMPLEVTQVAGLRSYPAPDSSEIGETVDEAAVAPPMTYPSPEQTVEGEQEVEAFSMAVEEPAEGEQDVSQEQTPESPLFSNGWRIAQVLLLVVALISAVVALILRRRTANR